MESKCLFLRGRLEFFLERDSISSCREMTLRAQRGKLPGTRIVLVKRHHHVSSDLIGCPRCTMQLFYLILIFHLVERSIVVPSKHTFKEDYVV